MKTIGVEGKDERFRGFEELRRLIEAYSDGDSRRQKMALKVISGAYLLTLEGEYPGDSEGTKSLVEGILRDHGYFVEHGRSGGLHPQSAYAVLNLAKHSGTEADRRWGSEQIFRMMEQLGRRSARDKGYVKHAADAALLSASLGQIVGAAQASRSNLAWAN